MAHLKPDRKRRGRLVVEGRSDPAGSAGVAIVALLLEDAFTLCDRRIARNERGLLRLVALRGAAAYAEQQRGGAQRRPWSDHRVPLSRVMRQITPVRGCAFGPLFVTVITPKSVTYNAAPSGSKRASTGRSMPALPCQEAGPWILPWLIMKSVTTPVETSTRTTRAPIGYHALPVLGVMSPNWAMKASPTCPNAGLREKSNPFDEELTASRATGAIGADGGRAMMKRGCDLPSGLKRSCATGSAPA